MKLPNYVKPYPSLFKYIKIFSDKGFNMGKTIYLNNGIYEDLKSDKPQISNLAILIHDETHRKRIKPGQTNWGFKYIFDRDFRLNEELIAYKEMFKFLKQHGESYDLDRVANAMSGHRYLWVKSYKDAKKIIEKAWEEA